MLLYSQPAKSIIFYDSRLLFKLATVCKKRCTS